MVLRVGPVEAEGYVKKHFMKKKKSPFSKKEWVAHFDAESDVEKNAYAAEQHAYDPRFTIQEWRVWNDGYSHRSWAKWCGAEDDSDVESE